jgi:hypothetical protein
MNLAHHRTDQSLNVTSVGRCCDRAIIDADAILLAAAAQCFAAELPPLSRWKRSGMPPIGQLTSIPRGEPRMATRAVYEVRWGQSNQHATPRAQSSAIAHPARLRMALARSLRARRRWDRAGRRRRCEVDRRACDPGALREAVVGAARSRAQRSEWIARWQSEMRSAVPAPSLARQKMQAATAATSPADPPDT